MFRRVPGTLSRPLLSAPLRAAAARAPFVAPRVTMPATVRAASTRADGTTHPGRWVFSTLVIGTVGLVAAVYYYDSRSVAHEHVVMPMMRALAGPEEGHRTAVSVLALPSWMRPKDMGEDGPKLHTEVMGLPLVNPIGMAAGFDKDAQCIDGLFDIGFSFVEVGSITPQPQSGNPQPRFFRLEEDDAAINRYGFNSQGHGQALGQLRKRLVEFSRAHPSLFPSPLPPNPSPPRGLPRSLRPGHALAVNLGKNKASAADSNDDYVRGVRTLGPYADVVVINVSSPNTPGLRALQSKDALERLLTDVVAERNNIAVDGLPKIAVKVTCDLGDDELADVASAVRKTGVDGVIVSNTTVRRDGLGLQSDNAVEAGGLSGRPLFPYALKALKTLRPLLPPNVPLIGAGGVWTGEDALEMCRAGASMVEVYTAFGYRGVGTPRLLKDEVAAALDPGSTWAGQVGTGYVGRNMGWDESRLAAESAAVRAEAAELGAVLAQIKDKIESSKLVEEAHEALDHLAAVNAATLSADGSASPDFADLLLSRTGAVLVETPDGGVDLIEATTSTPAEIVAAEGGEGIAIVTGTPATSVVVSEVETPAPQPDSKAEWAKEVHDGNKRLV